MRRTLPTGLLLVLLGIFTSASGPAQAALTLADHCNLNIRYLLARQHIRFPPSSATLRPSASALIDTIAEIAAGCPDTAISIEGHTDSRGDEAYNLALSEARAQSVADALAARGIAAARMQVRGMGSLRPIADNASRDGRAMNRRIEIRFSIPTD